MSTPIHDLAADVDDYDDGVDDYVQMKPKVKGKGAGNLKGWKKHIDVVYVFLAVIIAAQIPLDTIRSTLPSQVFIAGSSPIRAILVVIVYFILRMVASNMFD